MRKVYCAICTCILIAFALQSGTAQSRPSFRTSSYYTFIYKIDNERAGVLYKSMHAFDSSFLNNLFDFYPTDSVYRKPLPVGHYVFVRASEVNIVTELKSVNNLEINLLTNHRDLMLVVHDSSGRELKGLDVRLNRKKLPFHTATQTYRLRKANKQGLLRITHDGHVSYFEIERKYNNGWFVRSGKKILRFPPVRIASYPIRYIIGNIKNIGLGYGPYWPRVPFRKSRSGKSVRGYMAFNKPIFKPGDTVKFKAFLTNPKGKAFNKPVTAYLVDTYEDVQMRLGTIEPVRAGSYPFEFVLHDTLDLYLDRSHEVVLKFRDRELFSGQFKYEEYELKQNTYSVRHKDDPQTGKPELFLKGTDSNEMPLYDVQVDVLIKPVRARKFFKPEVFIPDTLWFYKGRLEPTGETKIPLPDSVFPAADIHYEAEISFYNSGQERTAKTIQLQYSRARLPVSIDLINDSLVVKAFAGFNTAGQVELEAHLPSGSVESKRIRLPYREPVDTRITQYKVKADDRELILSVGQQPDQLSVLSNRTADSLFVSTQNPRRIVFRYFLFRNQQLVESGEGKTLAITREAKEHDVYHLSLQYLWAGVSENQEFTIPFERNVLDVDILHPSMVYPGQAVNFDIRVTDAYGKPVGHTDLTAFAVSRKFPQSREVNVPDFSGRLKQREIINTFSLGRNHRFLQLLENAYWKKTLGLDSLEFYNLADPDSGYHEVRLPAATPQIAPFITGTGFEKASVIYINDVPVYYQGVTAVQPYSIAVRPGKHTIKLRVSDALITVRDVMVYENQKLIFSVDQKHLPARAQKVEMPYSFTRDEIKFLSRYFTTVNLANTRVQGYIKQGERYFLVKASEHHYNWNLVMGPFFPGKMMLVTDSDPPVELDYEPWYKYEFQKNIIKLRQYDPSAAFQLRNVQGDNRIPLTDEVLTADSIEAYWQSLRDARSYKFDAFPDSPSPANRARLSLDVPVSGNQRVLATFILNLNNPDEYYLFPGSVSEQPISPGHYEAAVLFGDKRYRKIDSIFVKPNGLNYYYDEGDFHHADSLSIKIIRLLSELSRSNSYVEGHRAYEMQEIRSQYYGQNSSRVNYGHIVTGQLRSAEDGEPLPGVSVMVKGTTIGTLTDGNGYYALNCPPGSVLIFSFIGLKTQQIATTNQSVLDIVMWADAAMLNEVVIVAGGLTVQRRELGFSVTSVRSPRLNAIPGLQGKVPGLAVSRVSSGMNPDYRVVLRGQRSLTANTRALVIIDGRIASMEEIEESSVTAIEVLSGDKASALYGSRASNGVLIISTQAGATLESLRAMAGEIFKTALPEEAPGNSLRRNFRDYAFWKPNLITDREGRATFEAVFPDDVTGWNVSVLAMAPRRRTGQTSGFIRSYKPMVAQIAHPQFLIEGDRSNAIGKMTAYNAGKVMAQRTVRVNNEKLLDGIVEFENSGTDSIALSANAADSISIEYMVSVDRYKDGELRKIPVFKKGTLEAVGSFIALNKDTLFNVPGAEGELIIHAETDLADVLLSEINYLRQYRYECNEQMASRLFGLLAAEQIMKLRGDRFGYTKEIISVIHKLSANQQDNGGWAWWGAGPESDPWVTLHVANSLTLAEEMGYTTLFDLQGVFRYLEGNLTVFSRANYLNAMKFLLENKRPVEVKTVANGIINSPVASLHDKLLAERLLQLAGSKADWRRIRAMRSETLKGNYRWGEDQNSVYDNHVLNTLIAYEIALAAGASATDLTKIRNFFLEARARTWRNTYESACVIRALTSLVDGRRSGEKPAIALSGGLTVSKQNLPATIKGKTTEPVTVSVTTNGSPVYFTAYREIWNPSPKKNDEKFRIETSLNEGQRLTVGKPVTLDVTVEVKSDAEYVMIEVPVPAGCSYQSKNGSRSNGEVHREHYNNKTNIYCRFLKKGTYQYSIFLLPRFSGSYTVNPAVVESMYFPVLHGNNEIKSVRIDRLKQQ